MAQTVAPARPARGPDVAIAHTYNSLEAGDGDFGYGWTINYARRLDTADPSTSVTYFDEDGSRHLFSYDSTAGAYVRPPGVFLTLTREGDGAFMLKDKSQVRSNFDSTGKLTSVVDRNGNTVALTYSSGKLVTITDASGGETTLTYSSGRLSRVTTADGRTNEFSYDGNGDLIIIKNATDTISSAFSYAGHRMTGATDALGRTTSISYENNMAVSITDPVPLSHETAFIYSGVATVVDGPRTDVNDVVAYSIDQSGLLSALTEPAPGGTTAYLYDDDWNRTVVVQPNSAVTLSDYDADGNRLSTTDPLTHTTYWSYNANNDVVNATDALSHVTAYSYNATGNLTKKLNADDTSETYVNNEYGQRTKMTNARGYDTDYTYTSLGLLDEERQGGGAVVTKHEYDLAGFETTTTDPLQHKTIQTYDDMGRVLSTQAPDGKTFFEYDAVGNQTKSSQLADLAIADMEADEDWTGGTSDSSNTKQGVAARKLTSTNGALALDAKSLSLNLAGADADSGFIDQWVYVDEASGLDTVNAVTISFDSTAGSSLSYAVPAVGLSNGWNLLHIAKIDFTPSGAASWATITGVTNTAKSGIGQTANVSFDDLRLTANKRKLEESEYDELGRLKEETDATGHSMSYDYDAAGNKIAETDSKGTTAWEFDAMNRETTVTDANEKTTLKGYDAVGNLAWVRDANESTTTHLYDLAERETTVTDPMGKSTRTEYDKVGNRLKVIDAASVETTYSYDALNRLQGVKDGLGNVTTYEHDAAGNQTKIIPPAPGGATINVYDELNRLYSSRDGALQTTVHQYDLAGRETTTTLPTTVVKTAEYDDAGNLVQTSDGTTTITYDYDMQGNTIMQAKWS